MAILTDKKKDATKNASAVDDVCVTQQVEPNTLHNYCKLNLMALSTHPCQTKIIIGSLQVPFVFHYDSLENVRIACLAVHGKLMTFNVELIVCSYGRCVS
jgi:hypothetical protein